MRMQCTPFLASIFFFFSCILLGPDIYYDRQNICKMRLNCSILNLWNMDLNIDVEITFKTFGQNVFLKGVEI